MYACVCIYIYIYIFDTRPRRVGALLRAPRAAAHLAGGRAALSYPDYYYHYYYYYYYYYYYNNQ